MTCFSAPAMTLGSFWGGEEGLKGRLGKEGEEEDTIPAGPGGVKLFSCHTAYVIADATFGFSFSGWEALFCRLNSGIESHDLCSQMSRISHLTSHNLSESLEYRKGLPTNTNET
jgi:hypothetical protein